MARFRTMSLPMMPAVCMSVVSTCLLVTGVFVPGHWVKGTDEIGDYHFSPFRFCRGASTSLCLPWDDHTYHKHHLLTPEKEEHVPGTVSCSHVVLSVAIIAFLVTNCLLLWCACISPTQYWAKNALECTISGFLHASGGTILFLTTRMSSIKEDSHVSVSWGAYMVLVALACQLLTALLTYLAITSPDALHPDHSSTTTCAPKATASDTEAGASPGSRKASLDGEQELKPEQLKKLRGITTSEDKMGSELLRIVHMYQHQNNQDNLMLRPVRFPFNCGPSETSHSTLEQLGAGAMAMTVDLSAWITQLDSASLIENIITSGSRQHSTQQLTDTMQADSPCDLELTMGEQSTDRPTATMQADSPCDLELTMGEQSTDRPTATMQADSPCDLKLTMGEQSTDQPTATMQADSPRDLKLTMGEQSTDQPTAAKQEDSPTDPKLTEVKSFESGPHPATVTSLQQVSVAMTPTAGGPPLQADAEEES